MKKSMSKVLVAMLIAILLVSVASAVLAVDPTKITATETEASKKVGTLSGQILGIVQVVGTAVAVIMLIVLAIKYISAAPNDKAEIKKHAVVYIVGAVILFGAVGLLQIVKGFGDTINKSSLPIVQVATLEK